MKGNIPAIAVVPAKRQVCLVDHPRPAIASPDEVMIRVREVGVCGTDREIASFAYGTPPAGADYLVLGHEVLGEVVEVGGGLTTLKPGDLVVASVRRPCPHDHCRPCRERRQDFCETGDFLERGIKGAHGYMTPLFVEKAEYLFHVPQSIAEVAVMTEPLTIAEKGLAVAAAVQTRLPWVKAPDSTGFGQGRNAVVLGAGPIGLLGAMALIVRGFRTFVYSRSRPPNAKAAIVESLGATYLSSLEVTPAELAAQVGPIDLVYEAAGSARLAFDVLSFLGENGIFLFTGIPEAAGTIELGGNQLMRDVVLKNQALVGIVNADDAAFAAALRDLGIFLERWPEAMRALISGRYPIESYAELLVESQRGIKNVITFA